MADVLIGVSGWRYKEWGAGFYPEKLPQRRQLEYVTRCFPTLEINGTFYSLKTPAAVESWAAAAPDGFIFAVKGSRYITQRIQQPNVKSAIANFFAQGILRLGHKLGPLLWQFPPNLKFNPDAVNDFCRLLPSTAKKAIELAGDHDTRVEGDAEFPANKKQRLRHAIEPRHQSWMTDEFLDILRRCGHALVVADTAGRHPFATDVTADFVYVRLHGSRKLYSSRYTDQELDWWARRIKRWRDGGEYKSDPHISKQPPSKSPRDVYVYFDNTDEGHAPYDAFRLSQRLNVEIDVTSLKGIEGDDLPPPGKQK